MRKDYQQRFAKEYNGFRAFFQWLTCTFTYGFFYKTFFGLRIVGHENLPKKGFYIVASNHVSAIDPFLVACAVKRPVAYMAKIELFEKKIMRFFLDLLGAFAVDREKLAKSTIKTVHEIKKTTRLFGIFPQGTREREDNMENINKGFASFAKTLKCDIIPIALIGMAREKRRWFRRCMTIKIAPPIKYNNDVNEMIKSWSEAISKMLKGEEENEPQEN